MPRRWIHLLQLHQLLKARDSPSRERWLASWRRVVWEVIERGEKVVAVAGLVNFLLFLYNGR